MSIYQSLNVSNSLLASMLAAKTPKRAIIPMNFILSEVLQFVNDKMKLIEWCWQVSHFIQESRMFEKMPDIYCWLTSNVILDGGDAVTDFANICLFWRILTFCLDSREIYQDHSCVYVWKEAKAPINAIPLAKYHLHPAIITTTHRKDLTTSIWWILIWFLIEKVMNFV